MFPPPANHFLNLLGKSIMIRKARKEDSFVVAELMLLAMSEIIYSFLGSEDPQQALEFIHKLVREPGNQYSLENTWVTDVNRQVIGSITVYDGAKLEQLRQPVLSLLTQQYGRNISPENETQAGEMYIDTIAVNREHQGKGVGTVLLKYAIDHFVREQRKTLGLLVDLENQKARNLYLQLGFEKVGQMLLMNHPYEHLQLRTESLF